jgi:DNA-binding transcriptional LysR family regulator
MTQKQIMYYEKAFDAGNIASAAKELFVSRSVVSRAILDLEEEFGVKLFERSKNGIEPTDAGIMLRSMFMEISGSYNTLISRFKSINEDDSRRTLRVGFTPTISRAVGRLLFREFGDEYQDILINATERPGAALEGMLVDGTADVVFIPKRQVPSPIFEMLERMSLYSVRLMLAVRKDDPLAKKRAVSIIDILDRPLGYLTAPIPFIDNILANSFSIFKKKPNIVLRTTAIELLRSMTQEGRICVLMPDDMLDSWDNVVGVPMDFADQRITYYLMWNKAVKYKSAVRDFIGFVKNYKAQHWADVAQDSII